MFSLLLTSAALSSASLCSFWRSAAENASCSSWTTQWRKNQTIFLFMKSLCCRMSTVPSGCIWLSDVLCLCLDSRCCGSEPGAARLWSAAVLPPDGAAENLPPDWQQTKAHRSIISKRKRKNTHFTIKCLLWRDQTVDFTAQHEGRAPTSGHHINLMDQVWNNHTQVCFTFQTLDQTLFHFLIPAEEKKHLLNIRRKHVRASGTIISCGVSNARLSASRLQLQLRPASHWRDKETNKSAASIN